MILPPAGLVWLRVEPDNEEFSWVKLGATWETPFCEVGWVIRERQSGQAHTVSAGVIYLSPCIKFTDVVGHAHDALAKVGLSAYALHRAGALSHGDKRRLEIAIVLASKSEIVLLDEPMAGMSVENVPELVEIIRSLATVHKKTVLIVEHHMEVILGLADRIAVLNYGELLVCDTPQNVIKNPIVQSAYIGEAL